MSMKPIGKSFPPVQLKTDNPVNDLEELSHIILNLRHHTRLWNIYYGSMHNGNKKRWEQRADEWLKNHAIDPSTIPVIPEEI